ncbi:MAG: hypothetical protein CMG60_07995 [Candidatus Marinimicrobia bacterium]|nr:hypothetical protein [Candidatus Neomarinimicrobiota bacterium]
MASKCGELSVVWLAETVFYQAGAVSCRVSSGRVQFFLGGKGEERLGGELRGKGEERLGGRVAGQRWGETRGRVAHELRGCRVAVTCTGESRISYTQKHTYSTINPEKSPSQGRREMSGKTQK